MMAWRICGLAAGLIGGIVVAAEEIWLPAIALWLIMGVGILVTLAGLRAEWRWRAWPRLAVAAATFCIAFPLGHWRTVDLIGPPAEGSLRHILQTVESGTRIHVRGTVSSDPESRGTGELDVELRVSEIRLGHDENNEWKPVTRGDLLVRVFARPDNPPEIHAHFNRLAAPAAYGWKLELSADYRHIDPPLNPGEFDYARFLRQTGVDTRLRCHASAVEILEESPGNIFMELALMTKAAFFETFKATVRSPASRMTAAATLGARRAVERVDYRDRDLATTLRHAGVGHVLAVSGLHVSVIAVMLFALFRMTGAKPKGFVPFLIFFLIMFALLTGARPSSVRAVIMNSVILIAIAYMRVNIRSATAIGLSLSAFFILLRNPTVLFAPSFLLSYGAVLSLIVLAPPLDRVLCGLRGFTLIFGIAWFSVLMRLAGWHLYQLIPPPNLLALFGTLWLMIHVGSALNHRMPRMWSFNLEKIPGIIRIFLAAQLAIQLGMMVPMSAWFFGQLPVAGVLVNLLAIPAVGVLVQLGMLTGLVGLIPVAGPWLAIPFGAATTLTGDLFILLAYIGSSIFPYPATPMPTPLWMFLYYASLGAFLFVESNRKWFLGYLYRLIPPAPLGRLGRLTVLLPALLILMPLLRIQPEQPALREVRILAEGRYPIVILGGPHHTTLINAGDRFSGGRLVFDSLRVQGATRVDTVLLPSSDPRAGIDGVPELRDKIHVSSVLLAVLPEPGQSLPEAIGDDYLIRQAERGTRWAVNIEQGFEHLRAAADEYGMRLDKISGETLPSWKNGSIRTLPPPSEMPRRFASSALTPIFHATINDRDWIFITDTTPDALFDALADITHCDVLVVPNLSMFATYGRWLRTALRRTSPKVLIIAGDRIIDPDELARWLPDDPDRVLIETGREGAVIARIRKSGQIQLETYRGDTTVTLEPK